jgi:hypothetical protein
MAALTLGCSTLRQAGGPVAPAPSPLLAPQQIGALIDPRVKERDAWGSAVAGALAGNGVAADPPSVCAVLAIIGQESTFQENPVVPGLAKMVPPGWRATAQADPHGQSRSSEKRHLPLALFPSGTDREQWKTRHSHEQDRESLAERRHRICWCARPTSATPPSTPSPSSVRSCSARVMLSALVA